jgi:predicted negative regulator of RcsB-dependent stress response
LLLCLCARAETFYNQISDHPVDLGSYRSGRYAGYEKVDELETLKAEVTELRKAVEALSSSKSGRDIWEKLGTFSTLFSSVILGAVGLFATHVYNQHLLEQQRQDSDEKARVERAQVLDKFWHYVVSAEPREREFGYAMFAYFDQADLALKLIALNRDQAGTAVVESLKQSTDANVRSAALQTLLTLQQEETLRRIIVQREGTGYDNIEDWQSDLLYGIGLWEIKDGSLLKLLDAYTRRPNAQYASQVKGLIAGGKVVKTPDLVSTLKLASSDPEMRQAQDDQFRADVIEKAMPTVRDLGLRLPLSLAIVCDTALLSGWGSIKKIAVLATEKTGNSPADGADEKQWALNFLDARVDYYKSSHPGIAKTWEAGAEAFRRIARSGDWMLTTAEGEAAIPQQQN